MQSQILNLLSVLNCCLYRDRSFINIVNSFTNKPTFFNIVPQLIKKTYRAGTRWFYRFACAIATHAHIYLMTRLADWDGLHNHLRDIPWEDVFKVNASAAASEFCEWVHVGINVYTPHRKYQVKPHTPLIIFTRISGYSWSSSRVHYWSYTFFTIH